MKKYIRDQYFRARGSTAKILDVICMKCNTRLLVYQKDGRGNLLRCYLNRIIEPTGIVPGINLKCSNCKIVVGTPMVYSDGRLAIKLRQHLVYKRTSEIDKEYE